MKKSRWAIVLGASLFIAALVGFFIYKNVQEKSKYIEVKFVDGYDNKVLSTQELEVGSNAKVPEVPKHDGCNFTGWYTKDKEKVENFENIKKNLTVYANCDSMTFKVKFYDTIGKKVVDTQKVMYGGSAEAPEAPDHYGYNFVRWKGKYTNVKSNVTVDAIYAAQKAKFTVKYYTLDDNNNATLYTTRTYNSYVNRKVKANIISIGGYKYDSSYKANKSTGRVDIDNSLVLKLYYSSRTYKITINGESNYYGYKDSVKLPNLPERTVTLTYNENENVTNKLTSNSVDLVLAGYCKNKKTCEKKNLIAPDTNVSVVDDAEYFPVWNMSMDLLLPSAEGYVEDSETYTFVSWLDEENVEHQSGKSFSFDEDTTLTAIYGNSSYDSTSTVKYVVNTYYDGSLHSSIEKTGLVGKQVYGNKFVEKIEGYNISYYTDSIFLSSNVSENVIELYYTNDEMLISSKVIDEVIDEETNELLQETDVAENTELEEISEIQLEEKDNEEELITEEISDVEVINDVGETLDVETEEVPASQEINNDEAELEEIVDEENTIIDVETDETIEDQEVTDETNTEEFEEKVIDETIEVEEKLEEQEVIDETNTEIVEEKDVEETVETDEIIEEHEVIDETKTEKSEEKVIEELIESDETIKEKEVIDEPKDSSKESISIELDNKDTSKDNKSDEKVEIKKIESVKETDTVKEQVLEIETLNEKEED